MKKRNLFYAYIVFSGLLVVGGVAVPVITYLHFVILALVVLLYPETDDIFLLLFYLMPSATIFKVSAGSASLFTYIQILFCVRLAIKIKFKKHFLMWFLFYAGYVLVGMGTEIPSAIKQILLPILFLAAMQYRNNKDIKPIAIMYSCGVLFASFCGYFLMDIIPGLSGFVGVKTDRVMALSSYVLRFGGLTGDPNYYSINVILAFVSIMYLHINKRISTVLASVFYIFFIFFGAMTGSKTFIIMLSLVLLWMISELWKNGRYFLSCMGMIAVIVGIGLIVSGKITIFDTIIARLMSSTGSMESLTTGRTYNWMQYVHHFIEHPFRLLIGNGLGAGYTFTTPHNTYVDYLDYYGILGSVLFLVVWLHAYKGLRIKKRILNYIPFICLLLMYFTLSMILYLDYIYQIILASLILFDVEENIEK